MFNCEKLGVLSFATSWFSVSSWGDGTDPLASKSAYSVNGRPERHDVFRFGVVFGSSKSVKATRDDPLARKTLDSPKD